MHTTMKKKWKKKNHNMKKDKGGIPKKKSQKIKPIILWWMNKKKQKRTTLDAIIALKTKKKISRNTNSQGTSINANQYDREWDEEEPVEINDVTVPSDAIKKEDLIIESLQQETRDGLNDNSIESFSSIALDAKRNEAQYLVENDKRSNRRILGNTHLGPWEAIHYQRLKRGPITTSNYVKRITQNTKYDMAEKYVNNLDGGGTAVSNTTSSVPIPQILQNHETNFDMVDSLKARREGETNNNFDIGKIDWLRVPISVYLLTSPNKDGQEQVVRSLENISGDSPKCRDLLIDHGVMVHLPAQFMNITKLSRIRDPTWTWSNFYSGNPQPQIDKGVIKANILPYSHALEKFAPHTQQFIIERNGRGVLVDDDLAYGKTLKELRNQKAADSFKGSIELEEATRQEWNEVHAVSMLSIRLSVDPKHMQVSKQWAQSSIAQLFDFPRSSIMKRTPLRLTKTSSDYRPDEELQYLATRYNLNREYMPTHRIAMHSRARLTKVSANFCALPFVK
eukprot:Gb_16309 [translate_table: standard]